MVVVKGLLFLLSILIPFLYPFPFPTKSSFVFYVCPHFSFPFINISRGLKVMSD